MLDPDYLKKVSDLFQNKLLDSVQTIDHPVFLAKCAEDSLIWTGWTFENIVCGYMLYACADTLRKILYDSGLVEYLNQLENSSPGSKARWISVNVPVHESRCGFLEMHGTETISMFVGITREDHQ